MMAKTVLVMWLLVSRSEVQMQFTLHFPSEAACQVQAIKIENKNKGFLQSYPVQHAECVVDATPLINQTNK